MSKNVQINSQYVILALFIVTFIFDYILVCVLLLALWYFLNGFVSISSFLINKNRRQLACFFLTLTCPFLLLPYRKAWYYMLRVIALPGEPYPTELAMKYARKIDAKALQNENSQSYYHGILAHIYAQAGQQRNAKDELIKARALPHNAGLDELFSTVEKSL